MSDTVPGAAGDPAPGVRGLVGDVRARLAGSVDGPGPQAPRSAGAGLPSAVELTRHVRAAAGARGRVLGIGDLAAAVTGVGEHAWGLGPLRPLVDDVRVTDVLVNGPGSVWVDRGGGLRRVAVDLGGEDEVRALAVRLATSAGRRLDESVPWVDARLSGGIRLHAVIPPVSPGGTHLSLRVLRAGRLDLDALVATGCVPGSWREVLLRLITQRAAFLVTGGTGAGKTTLLAALLSLVPAAERLLLVEDVGELQPDHPHVVRLEARHANVEGRGAVPLEELVRQALRMRPDRIVVGECRGPEVRDLSRYHELNTGGAGLTWATAGAGGRARLLGWLCPMLPRQSDCGMAITERRPPPRSGVLWVVAARRQVAPRSYRRRPSPAGLGTARTSPWIPSPAGRSRSGSRRVPVRTVGLRHCRQSHYSRCP